MYVKIGTYPETSGEEREVDVRIDDYDVWNLDHTLSLIILPALKLLKEKKHGAPFVDDSDVPDNLKSNNALPKENEWDTDSLWFDRWDYVIDEMIWAFQEIVFYELNKPHFTNKLEWESYHSRIRNGTRLFGVYFKNLWD